MDSLSATRTVLPTSRRYDSQFVCEVPLNCKTSRENSNPRIVLQKQKLNRSSTRTLVLGKRQFDDRRYERRPAFVWAAGNNKATVKRVLIVTISYSFTSCCLLLLMAIPHSLSRPLLSVRKRFYDRPCPKCRQIWMKFGTDPLLHGILL